MKQTWTFFVLSVNASASLKQFRSNLLKTHEGWHRQSPALSLGRGAALCLLPCLPPAARILPSPQLLHLWPSLRRLLWECGSTLVSTSVRVTHELLKLAGTPGTRPPLTPLPQVPPDQKTMAPLPRWPTPLELSWKPSSPPPPPPKRALWFSLPRPPLLLPLLPGPVISRQVSPPPPPPPTSAFLQLKAGEAVPTQCGPGHHPTVPRAAPGRPGPLLS